MNWRRGGVATCRLLCSPNDKDGKQHSFKGNPKQKMERREVPQNMLDTVRVNLDGDGELSRWEQVTRPTLVSRGGLSGSGGCKDAAELRARAIERRCNCCGKLLGKLSLGLAAE